LSKQVDRDAVTWAYRLFLGREPENEAVVRAKEVDYPTFQALCQAFLMSDEFR
jgi:hypothetical protein